jgi:hypothetical protein
VWRVSSGARSPKAAEISAALAALGVYAAAPSEHELEAQAEQAGGEDVLAAALANALYGAAIGVGMLTEGRMQERRGQNSKDLTLARRQALMASGAEGPGFAGAMHWQASHIAGPLRALKDHEIAPLGQAVAAVSWALVLLLQSMCLAEPGGAHAEEVTDCLTTAKTELAAAHRHLDRLGEQMAAAADALYEVVTAAENAMHATGNGHGA